MKLTKVSIQGMHKVDNKEYNLNDIAYIVGNNGSGKSTILQAIQLGLLGYVPGYNKTSEGIFSHCNGNILCVKITLDDAGTIYTVTRTWTRIKADGPISSAVTVSPDMDIESIVKDLELPIFNFNEFLSLSPNKMKEWFLDFMPSGSSKVDWEAEISAALSNIDIIDSNLQNECVEWANSNLSGDNPIEDVKAANKYFKEMASFVKSEADTLQKTMESLVYYDDFTCNISVDEAKASLSDVRNTIRDLDMYQAKVKSFEDNLAKLKSLGQLADTLEEDDEYATLQNELNAAKELDLELGSSIDKLSAEIAECNAEANTYKISGTGLCPYTKEMCSTAKGLVESNNAKVKEILDKVAKLSESRAELVARRNTEGAAKVADATRRISELAYKYKQAELLKEYTATIPERPTQADRDFLISEESRLTEYIMKAAANEKYNQLIDTIKKDKYKNDSSVIAYKALVKLTDVNGLQAKLSEDQFDALASTMSCNLSEMFGKETKACFNLSSKANSFSFGIIREDKYIPFQVLSSGEKCLYTVALMICIFSASTKLKLILVDDLIDHLDDENANHFFESLLNLKDIQFIMAGVKKCSLSDFVVNLES